MALSAAAIIITGMLLPGVEVTSYGTAIIVALVLAFLNSMVKPILVFLTLPATLVTFGLFLIVINTAIILLADWFVDGFNIDGFWWALLFSVILSFISSFFYRQAGLREDG